MGEEKQKKGGKPTYDLNSIKGIRILTHFWEMYSFPT
jgi:hypothetical protein